MKKRLGLLSVFLLVTLIFSFTNVYASSDSLDMLYNRAYGAVITISIVVTLWIILGIRLLKPEPKVVKVNMADRYRDISLDELEKLKKKKYTNIMKDFKLTFIKNKDNEYVMSKKRV